MIGKSDGGIIKVSDSVKSFHSSRVHGMRAQGKRVRTSSQSESNGFIGFSVEISIIGDTSVYSNVGRLGV